MLMVVVACRGLARSVRKRRANKLYLSFLCCFTIPLCPRSCSSLACRHCPFLGTKLGERMSKRRKEGIRKDRNLYQPSVITNGVVEPHTTLVPVDRLQHEDRQPMLQNTTTECATSE